MELLQPDRPPSVSTLIRVLTILAVLLIAQTAIALFGDALDLLDRFRTVVYLFVIGAILAYLMAPLVRFLQRVMRVRWIAVVASYLSLLVGLVGFGILLLDPFISQAQSLVTNLRTPASSSLVALTNVKSDIAQVQSQLIAQQHSLATSQPVPQAQVQQTQEAIARLAQHLSSLSGTSAPGGIQIPPSYVNPMLAPVNQLRADYQRATSTSSIVVSALASAVTAANAAATEAKAAYAKVLSTPLLLLDLQTLLDKRGVQVDLHDKFGQALQQLSNQVASLLNNAVSITLQAGNLLLNVVLMLIVSIYFVADGSRFIRWLIQHAPARSRGQVAEAVGSLDGILGSYVRTQVILALLAGTADATGAAVLGIPYPVVIFFSSFSLSLVPVIGPVILYIPPFGIALLFTPLPRPIFYLAWLLVGEQCVTNVIGPRLQAHNLRIHPLEAMAAALVGLPLAGLPGAFFAVPTVAFLHIVVREFTHARPPADPAPPRSPRT